MGLSVVSTWTPLHPFTGAGGGTVILPGDFYEALHAYLTDTIDVAGGWHFGRLPTKPVYPAVSYWLIAGTEERIWGGGPIQRKRMQFTVFATDDADLRLVMRRLMTAMRAIKRPNRLRFVGGNVARADLIIDRIYLDEKRENQARPLWMGMLDYMFEVQYESE